jgi:hypothetical protein
VPYVPAFVKAAWKFDDWLFIGYTYPEGQFFNTVKEINFMFKLNGKTPIMMGAVLVLALSQAAVDLASAQTKKFEPFVVYKDKPSPSHFAASGFMPNGKCVAVNDVWIDNCGGSRSCIQAKFDAACAATGTGWAGVYWLEPADNWGDYKGGFNLTGAKKLVFGARGEKGGEVVTFKMGGVGMGHAYPDSDDAATAPTVLTKDWKEYSIDLTGKDLSHIIGGFAWVATAKDNKSSITFYVRDIYYN